MRQMFKKANIIFDAWVNVFNGFTTKEHKRRASVCDVCPSKEYRMYLDFIDDELKEVKGFTCIECGCPLVSKIRSKDNCPLKKW